MHGREKNMYAAIEKDRVAGKPAVLIAVNSPDPKQKQELLNILAQRYKLTPYKKGLYVLEEEDSIPPVKAYIQERFPNIRFVSMVEIEMFG